MVEAAEDADMNLIATLKAPRLSCFAAIAAAVMLVAGNGATAASHGSSGGGGSHSNGTPMRIRPALQACTGPTHRCGKPPVVAKCHYTAVHICPGGHGRPGGPECPTKMMKACN